MMKLWFVAVLVVCGLAAANAADVCGEAEADVPRGWQDMTDGCVKEVKRQIQAEIDASMLYLAMGAHFSQDTVNRPGFAKFFFESAAEEREHGHKLIEYLLMRGQLTGKDYSITNLIHVQPPSEDHWPNGVEALKAALRREAKVTHSIRRVIEQCEEDSKFNDYHLVDYLTGTYLEEQYTGQRALAGKISTLDKMMAKHGAIGEFLFDKKLAA